MTAPQLPLPDPGAIHIAYLRWRLFDGTYRGEWRRVLIIDAVRDEEDVMVLWCPQEIHDPVHPDEELPSSTTYEHSFTPDGAWGSAPQGADATVVSISAEPAGQHLQASGPGLELAQHPGRRRPAEASAAGLGAPGLSSLPAGPLSLSGAAGWFAFKGVGAYAVVRTAGERPAATPTGQESTPP